MAKKNLRSAPAPRPSPELIAPPNVERIDGRKRKEKPPGDWESWLVWHSRRLPGGAIAMSPAELKAKHTCPNCEHTGPVWSDFGVRLKRGIEGKQSWCNDCRKGTNYYAKERTNRIREH